MSSAVNVELRWKFFPFKEVRVEWKLERCFVYYKMKASIMDCVVRIKLQWYKEISIVCKAGSEFLCQLLYSSLGTSTNCKADSPSTLFVTLIGNPISSNRIWRYLEIKTEFGKCDCCYERRLAPKLSRVKLEAMFVYTTLEILSMFSFCVRKTRNRVNGTRIRLVGYFLKASCFSCAAVKAKNI